MKKRFGMLAIAASIMAVSAAFAGSQAISAKAEGPEEATSVSAESAESAESVEESVESNPETGLVEITYKVFHIDESTGERIEDPNNKYGDVAFSSEKGEPGDPVMAIVHGNPTIEVKGKQASLFRYVVKTVWFNGVAVQPSNYKKGEYEITLVEGTNSLEVDFSGKAEISVVDLAGLNWQALFTVDNLLRLIVLVALVLVSSGFFLTLIKGKKIKAITADEMAKAVKKIVAEEAKSFLENDVKPMLQSQVGMNEQAAEATSVIMRVTLLAQENTPEARLEIIKELQKYKRTDAQLAQQIEKIVNESIERRNKAAQEEKDAIEATKQSVRDLKPMEDASSEGEGFGSL